MSEISNELEYEIKENWTGKVLLLTQREKWDHMSGYQVNMLRENKIKHLLPVEVIEMDEKRFWQYEINDKISWKDQADRTHIKKEELSVFFQSLYIVLDKMEEFLLDTDTLILNPAFIYKDEKQYYFCCYPPMKKNFSLQVEELKDFIANVIDVKDEETVKYFYNEKLFP